MKNKYYYLKLNILCILCIILCVPTISNATTPTTSIDNIINVAIYNNPPLQTYKITEQQLAFSGLSIDYLNLLFQETDYSFKYTYYDSLDSAIKADNYDILFLSTGYQPTQNSPLLSNPYASFPIVGVKNATNVLLNNFSDTYTHPHITNTPTLNVLNTENQLYNDTLIYNDTREALDYISLHSDTAYMTNMASALYGIQEYGFNNLVIFDTSDLSEEMLLGVHPNNEELYQLILDRQNAIDSFKLLELKEKWMPVLLNSGTTAKTSIDLTPEEKAFLESHPIIRVANDLHWAPYSFTIDNQPMGISTDILRIIENKLDVKFDLVCGYTWEELSEMIVTREIDILQPIIYHESRKDFLTVTEPIFNVHHSILENPSNPISSIEDLYGKRVGIGNGYTISKIVAEEYPEIILVPFDSISEGLTTLDEGELDGYIAATEIFNYYKRISTFDNVQISHDAELRNDISNTIRLGVRNDWPILVKILNKAINSFTDEELLSLTTKWGTTDLLPNNSTELNYEEYNWLLDHPVVTVGLYPTWKPIDYVDNNGELQGIAKKYLSTFEEKLGITFEVIINDDWSYLYNGVVSGDIDMISSISPSEQRKNELLFTDSYLTTPIVIFGNKQTQFFSSINELKGKRVCIVKSFVVENYITQDYDNLNIIYASDTLNALHMLENGDVDVFIANLPVTSYYIDMYNFDHIYVAGKTEYTYNDSFATNYDNIILHGILKKTLASIPQEEKDYINTTWFSNQIINKPNYAPFFTIIAVALFIVLIIFYSYLRSRALNKKLKENQKLIERLTITDELTGLYNRRYFNQVFETEYNRAKREGKYFVFAIIDIDNFKQYNDTYGHGEGDLALQTVSKSIQNNTKRSSDYVFRLGGEEFGIIYTTDSDSTVLGLPKNILTSIQDLEIEHTHNEDYNILTVSIGVHPVPPKEHLKKTEIYTLADTALYKAKSDGRNCIRGNDC